MPDMMADLIAITVPCEHCHGMVTLHVTDWRNAAAGQPSQSPAVWTCPSCQRESQGRLPGRLELVVPADEVG